MGTLFVDKLDPQSGTSLEIGSSGDTITIPSGCTITNSGTNGGGFGLSEIATPYAGRMYKGSAQTISNDTFTKLDFASGDTVINKGSIIDLSNSRITVPSGAAGLWIFWAHLRVNNMRANRNMIELYKNGSTLGGGNTADTYEMGYWGNSGQYSSLSGWFLINAAVSDYFEPYFKQNSGSSDTIIQRSFSGWYLGVSS
jgi:hypothetical protein